MQATATRFLLSITLGNAAMSSAADLAAALRRIADDVEAPRDAAPFAVSDEDGILGPGWYQTILDGNGNDVGRYAVKDSDD